MVDIFTTDDFDQWLRRLKDRQARLRILGRIDRLAHGNPGDAKPVGRGVSELRLTYGPGYRVYYLLDGGRLVVLLCRADKSAQQADISRAYQLADQWRRKEG